MKWRCAAAKGLISFLTAVALVVSLTSCGDRSEAKIPGPTASTQIVKKAGKISEVSPPEVIQTLRQGLEQYQPQVTIVSPRPNEVLQDNTVSVRFQVKDLPIFQDSQLGLGPHLHVILDNEPYEAVYNLDQPLVLKDLTPGTHTLRVFASRPWHESFKNEGAYAQATFHVFTKTLENSPNADQPLLTYSRPKGAYGAEPVMLDFYLTNAPLHWVAQENADDDIPDWRIRCTINGESFIVDRWQPIYLKGFQPGKNWVQLELIDEQGKPVTNAFNDTARLITYEPNGTDTLSKLVRGDISAQNARSIIDPNYQPESALPATTPEPSPLPLPTPEPKELPIIPEEPIQIAPGPQDLELEPEAARVTEPQTEAPSIEESDANPSVTEEETEEEPAAIAPAPAVTPQKPGGFFNRFRRPESVPVLPTPVAPELPPVIEAPISEDVIEAEPEAAELEVAPEQEPEAIAEPEAPAEEPSETTLPKKLEQPEKPTGFFGRFRQPAPVSPTVPPTAPEIIQAPEAESIAPEEAPATSPAIEMPESTESESTAQEIPAPKAESQPGSFWNRFRRPEPDAIAPVPSPMPKLPEILEAPEPEAPSEIAPEAEPAIAPTPEPTVATPKPTGFFRFQRPETPPAAVETPELIAPTETQLEAPSSELSTPEAEIQPEEQAVDEVAKYKDIFEQLRRPQPTQVLPAPVPAPKAPEVVAPAPRKFDTSRWQKSVESTTPKPPVVKPQPTPAAPIIQAPDQSERLRQLREKFTAPASVESEETSEAGTDASDLETSEVEPAAP